VTPPRPSTLVAPAGVVSANPPRFVWNAAPAATYYYLWVNDEATGRPVVRTWYTAAAAGCAGGTGTCAITPQVTLGRGAHRWWIQTWNDAGYGFWSASLLFTIP
jgi:hypothetical protein